MFPDMEAMLCAAIARSLEQPDLIVRAMVPSINDAVEMLASHAPEAVVHWRGNSQQVLCWGQGWSVRLIVGEQDEVLHHDYARVRPSIYLPANV